MSAGIHRSEHRKVPVSKNESNLKYTLGLWTIFLMCAAGVLFAPVAAATSASISVSRSGWVVNISVSGSITAYPTSNSGTYIVYYTRPNLSTSELRRTYAAGAFSWSMNMDGGKMAQGIHRFSVYASDSKGIVGSDSATIEIDNTPTLNLDSPGAVRGIFNATGTIEFKDVGDVYSPEGRYAMVVDGDRDVLNPWGGIDFVDVWSANYPFSNTVTFAGHLSNGEHTLYVQAIANNGTSTAMTRTFTVSNNPVIDIEDPGQPTGPFYVRGTINFATSNGDDYGRYAALFDDRDLISSWGGIDYRNVGRNINYPFEHYVSSVQEGMEHTITILAYGANGELVSNSVTFYSGSLNPEKEAGAGCTTCKLRPQTDNPITFSTGNKYKRQTDFALSSPGLPLVLSRHYNSQRNVAGMLGYGWSHSFGESVSLSGTTIRLFQADGKRVDFPQTATGEYISEVDDTRTIVQLPEGGYLLAEPDGRELMFDDSGVLTRITDRNGNYQELIRTSGRLASIVDNFGRQVIFTYNADDRVETVSSPVGIFTYGYDTNSNLSQVSQPDSTTISYLYEDTNDSHNLTGIIDETGTRIMTVTYDTQDRAVTSERAGGVGKVTVAYVDNAFREVTDSLGNKTRFRIHISPEGIGRVKYSEGAGCSSCRASLGESYEFTDRLEIATETDAEGTINSFTYDDRGNILTKTEAVGTAEERTTTYTWHPLYNLPATITRQSIANPGQSSVTTFEFDAAGNILSRNDTGYNASGAISTTTGFTYNAEGQLTTIDGPRTDVTDVTTIEYYPNTADQGDNRGRLWIVTDANGRQTVYSQYNAFGKPRSVVDPNGIETVITYDDMGRPTHQITAGAETVMGYDAAGRLTTLQLPNGSEVSYGYTPAGLLETVSDSLGNTITYQYDTEGNRLREEVSDAMGALKKYADFAYDAYNRLETVTLPGNLTESYVYDLNNLPTLFTDAGGKTTVSDYDALRRITTVTQPGDTVTSYGYDTHDNLTSVTDAEGQVTSYVYDDFGRVLEEVSADAGTTRYAYDAAGNMTSKTDALGVTTTYSYDALNRLTGIHFPDSSQDVIYTYDEGANGVGRLTGMSDPSGTASYSYDPQGRLVTETRTIDGRAYTTDYGYDAAGILTSMTYPDGRVITLVPDAAGRITQVTTTVDGTTTTLASGIDYLPFGPLQQMTLGNGTVVDKTFDESYRLTHLTAGSLMDRVYGMDAVGNITAITDALDPTRSQGFTYDDLYRLTGATGIYGAIGYTYDKVGNRLTRTENGETDTFTYVPGTHRLDAVTGASPMQFGYDANGSTTAMGDRSLIYNQNKRLIEVVEGTATLGEYVYNGQGQRIKKTANGETTIFHWDRFGNVIGESDVDGNFAAAYVYLGMTRVAALRPGGTPTEITVQVATDEGRTLSGVKVYAFTDAGSYTGRYAVTGADGAAVFTAADFAGGHYKFRADYLSDQFWSGSITVPGTYSAAVDIPEETTTVLVTRAGVPVSGVKVYLFNESGAYLGQYQTTDAEGQVSFVLPEGQGYKFRADLLGSRYFSGLVTVTAGQTVPVAVDTGGGLLSFTLQKGEGVPMAGVKTYLFSESGSYLGISMTTGENGVANYPVSSGTYKIRADYLGYQYWSNAIVVAADTAATLTLPHQEVTVTIAGDNAGDVIARVGVKVYLFTESGSYQGVNAVTNENGQAVFSLPASAYKVRADYMGQQFWSEVFTQADAAITIPEAEAAVTVTRLNQPQDSVPVYVFTAAGSYLGLNGTSSEGSALSFRLPAGNYNFRADYLGSQYFSGNTAIIAGQTNPVTVSTGGGNFTLTVQEAAGVPMAGVKCYLFSEAGAYLGHQAATSAAGEAPFDLADGSYKIRVDYLGYQYWTPVFTVPADTEVAFDIPHQDVTVTVQSEDGTTASPLSDIKTYLFTEAGAYQGVTMTTDAAGTAVYHLPANAYKIRADYLSQQYWSDLTVQEDKTVTIAQGIARVQVSQGTSPIENVKVYAFTTAGSYLGINFTTDASGEAAFTLPTGSYKFRADYQGSQFWATATVSSGVDTPVALTTGGGVFLLTVQTDAGAPLTDIPVYVFSTSGSYLGINTRTDETGVVQFDLADGGYMFRADYRGYQFWTNICTVPDMFSDVLSIAHTDVTISVSEAYGTGSDPISGVKVYLFTAAGSYQGVNTTTDANGELSFTLPNQDYKARADYLGQQFWSDVFNGTSVVAVDIPHGYADIHVTDLGADVSGASVYLFTESGSYLGRMQTTDTAGAASFLIPAGAYKFRVDHGGSQYWSDIINVLADEAIPIEMPLDLLALDTTLNPHPHRFDGTPPRYRPEPVYLASLLDITGILTQTVIVGATTQDEVYYYINDHLGTPQKMIDAQGNVVWEAAIKPFGQAAVANETVKNRFRFAGQYFDTETGLHYNYHRYYEPKTGRYLRVDPIGLNGGINLFSYVQNDPVNLMDPYGRNPIGIIIGAIAGGIGGATNAAINGNYASAIIGGVSGAIVGGLVGTVNPFGSSAAGAIAASWTAGVIGGFGGGAFGGFFNWATDPCASESDVLASANEGAIGSAIVGLFTAPFGVIAQSAAGSSAAAIAAVESANGTVGIGLGAATSNVIPKGGVFVGR